MMPSLEPTDRPSNPWKQLLNECLHCSPSQGTIHAEVQLAADDCGIQEIRGLVVEDQEKLLEIIDEVRRLNNLPLSQGGKPWLL